MTSPAARPASSGGQVTFHAWRGRAGFTGGRHRGTTVRHGALVLGGPVGTLDYTDPFGEGHTTTYEFATWLSPRVRTPFGLTELVSSWNATTPAGTWLQVEVSGRTQAGVQTTWHVLGRWACGDSGDPAFHRACVEGRADGAGAVDTDTFATRGGHVLADYQLRVTLFRASGGTATPAVRLVGAVASGAATGPDHPPVDTPEEAPPCRVAGTVLDVPRYSQELHRGSCVEYAGGGESWCSAASTAMVLDYWDRGPSRREMAWLDPAYPDPQVAHAARSVFDYGYGGTGNWSFNVAYAGSRGLEAFVTRLGSLAEAERFIDAGIPLVVSASFAAEELDGAGYATDGHLMVLVGFDRDGNPVVNDPASHRIASDEEVRVTYDRAQLERAWSRSGRTVYVCHPVDAPLPDRRGGRHW